MPPSSSEVMLAWEAARAKSPYITIAGVKVHHPAILLKPASLPHVPPSVYPTTVIYHPVSYPTPSSATPSDFRQFGARERIKALRDAAVAAPAVAVKGTPAISPPHDALPPVDGFVLSGEIALLGNDALTAQFEVWEGPPPTGVTTRPDEPVSVERATLAGDFHFSALMPALQGSVFDHIIFRNISILHQNYQVDTTRSVGWHLDAQWIIDESCGSLRDVLSTVLGVKEPVLNVHASLDVPEGWEHALELQSFTLEGIFAGVSVKPVDGLAFTEIGVRLSATRSLKLLPQPHNALQYSFVVYGNLDLDIPSSVVPLKLKYEMQENGGTIHLSANAATWTNPLGVHGLTLRNASFSTSLNLSKPWDSFALQVTAYFSYNSTSASFTGSYSPGGLFELSATIHDFNAKNLVDLFISIDDKSISVPSAHIIFGSASITIKSQDGLTVALDKVSVGDHTALDASLQITSYGVLVQGALTSSVVTFGDVAIKNARLRISYETVASAKKTNVTISGNVSFSGLTFEVTVYIYEPTDSANAGLQWTALASLGNSLALSKVIPEVRGTFLDFALHRVVFVAASRNNPDIGDMDNNGYHFHQGVQICAALDELAPLNSLVRSRLSGLVLSIGWSELKGFELDIIPPTQTLLNLGNGMTTTPLKPSIQTKPLGLTVSTDLKVPVPHSTVPLLFALSLGVDLVSASATGEMDSWWMNPLGLGPGTKIGPKLALSFSCFLAQFASTGTLSGFGIQGGLMIGNTQVQVSLSVNEDPMKELLHAEADSLNMVDIVSFAEDVTGLWLPRLPRDFLHFEQVKIYICPTGMTLGTTTYPQGFSFAAGMVVFGKKADVSCKVEATQIVVEGDVDNFELGPLKLRGKNGPRATLDCTIGPSIQHLLMDGMITLFEAETAAHIEMSVYPNPKLSWYTLLKFTDVLTFQLNASLIGALTFSNLSSADFTFDALLEQDVLKYLNAQILSQCDEARKAAEDGLERAREKVARAQVEFDGRLKSAELELEHAFAAWQAKDKSLRNSCQPIIDAYNAETGRLRNEIQRTRNEYDAALRSAQNTLDAEIRNRVQNMTQSQHDVDDAERKMQDDIRNAQRDLDMAEAAMDREFGSAQQDIEKARRDVQSLQVQITNLYTTIHDYATAPQYEFWKKASLAGLYINVGVLEASKVTADDVLKVAESVLSSVKYITRRDAIDTARAALNQASIDGQAVLGDYRGFLQDIDITTQAAVTAAEKAWQDTQQGAEWLTYQTTIEALDAYQKANDAAFREAQTAIQDLTQSTEYLAYHAATATLAVVRSFTVELDATKKALGVVERAEGETAAIGKWVASHLSPDLFDIRVVHLSGRLSELVELPDETTKPLVAHVEGLVMHQSFSLDCQFDPRRTADFIASVFKTIWNELGKLVN